MEIQHSRKKSVLSSIVAILLVAALGAGAYTLNQKHQSTISSLKSELSTKDQVIQAHRKTIDEQQAQLDQKDSLLEEKNSILKQRQSIIESNVDKAEELQKRLEIKQKQLEDLQNQAKLERKDMSKVSPAVASKIVTVSNKQTTKVSAGNFASGWQATYYGVTGKTASGRQTKDGITVAVDPRIIPLDTWIQIKMPNGKIIKRRADDTGSAVKGRVIDIYVAGASSKELRQLGRHPISVKVLGKGDYN